MFAEDKAFQNLLIPNLLSVTTLTAHIAKCLHPKYIGFLMPQFYKCCLHLFFPNQSSSIAVLETGMCWNWSIIFYLWHSFYYLCERSFCQKAQRKMTRDAFSLMNVSKYDFGESNMPCPATLFLSLTAAARLVEHREYEFNQCCLITEAKWSPFSFGSGLKKCYRPSFYLWQSVAHHRLLLV